MKKGCECQTSAMLCLILIFSTLLPLVAFAQPVSYKIAAVGRSDFNTVRDDLDELMAKGKISGYDLYTESNIEDLWSRLNEYQILIIDEDCMFDWDNPGPDYNRPIPVLPIGKSFYNHKNELKQWIYNGGGLFSTDQNDISFDVPVSQPWTDEGNVWWTWMPDDLQVESNEFPSNYPEIGYGHDPWNLEVIYDPGIFSYPNKIDVTKVSKYEAHGRFTKYPGYTALVRDKSNGDILEVYRSYGAGVVVLSHLEYETADPWDVNYIENELYLISPQRKDIGLTLYIEDAIKGEDELAAPLVNKAPGDKIDIIAAVSNREKDPYDIDVVFEVPADLSFEKAFTRDNFLDIDERAITPTISGNKYTVTLKLEGSRSRQIVLRFTISTSAPTTICPIVYARAVVEGIVCSSATTMYNMVNNVKAVIVTNRHLIIQRHGLDERIDKALNWAFSKLGSTEYKYECLSFVEDAYAKAGSDPRNNIPIPSDPGFRYAKYVAEFLNAKIGTSIPPRGAWMFYDWTGWVDLNNNGVKDSGEIRNWGHVGISLGDGHVIHALGKVQINSIQEMEEITIQSEKLKYVGWAWPPLTPSIGYSFSKELLSYLYKISDWREENCIVYYVDHYDESLKKWDQKVDYSNEEKANGNASKIDDLIEEWAEKLAQKRYLGPILISKKYPYLVIVGGDEVIPFYRVNTRTNFPQYNSELSGYCYEEKYGLQDLPAKNDPVYDDGKIIGYYDWGTDSGSTADPVLEAYNNEYFLTDMKYNDLDDKDWTKGSINLASGRITGASTRDMKKLIENGLKGPANSKNAVVGTTWLDKTFVEGIKKLRDKKGLNILNDGKPSSEIPITFSEVKKENDWGASTLIEAMKKGLCIFEHSHHGDYWVLYCPKDDMKANEELMKDDVVKIISSYRPFVVTDSCHTGVTTDKDGAIWKPASDDNLAWALISDGASGFLAVMSFGWGGYSDKLHGIFYEDLTKPSGAKTNPVGESLRYAITHYDAGLNWDTLDKVAVTEPILYGIPWMTIDPQLLSSSSDKITKDFEINMMKPEQIAANKFKITIVINVLNYSILKVNNFDLININGSEEIREDGYPIIPKVNIPVSLPLSANNINLSLVSATSTSIGPLNIPCFVALRKNVDGSEMTTCTGLTELFPTPLSWLSISEFDEYKRAVVSSALAQWNPETNETMLYTSLTLELTYETPLSLAVVDFKTDKSEYLMGEPINASVTLMNVGSNVMHDLKGYLILKDCHGKVQASAVTTFDIDSGETKEIPIILSQELPHGTYLLEIEIRGSDVLGFSTTYVSIKSGEIVGFSAPSEVKSGDDITFEVSFMNAKTVDVSGESVIYIYDPYGIEIAELHSLPTTFPAISTTQINITWSTIGREYGTYTASAMVYAGDESFGPSYHTFEITPPDDIPPITTLEINEPKYVDLAGNIYVSSVTPFALTAEDNPGGTGVALTFYRVYNSNDTGWIEYSAPFYLTRLSDGKYLIDYYSIDNIGNVEPTKTTTVILDNTPPITTLTISGPKYVSYITYVTPDTPFILEAEDAGAGVNATNYRIYNSTYDSGWMTYGGPFNLTSLVDGTYTIEYYSIDNVQNAEPTQAINVTLFSWNYIFEDTYGRGTILKINLAHKFFQFITPENDYGIRNATYMRQCGRAIIIQHCDGELRLITISVDTKLDFCLAIAWDQQTRKQYFLIDKAGNE
jgi:hypothetical protein